MLHFNHMNYVSRATVTCDVQRNELTLRQTTLRHQRHGHPAGRLSDEWIPEMYVLSSVLSGVQTNCKRS